MVTKLSDIKIRCRDDGHLEGVRGPVYPCMHNRKSIAARMGWEDFGYEAQVITQTIYLLLEGKAVKLTSHLGYNIFQPLAPDEDGTTIPRSRDVVYDAEGQIVERLIKKENS